jgi:GTPase SAR1 family protein
MSVFKILVMGLPASGKTTFIKHVFEGKKFNELKEYVPTVGVHISLHKYKGSEQVRISSFDCGGQTSFIDCYFTDQWVPNLFREASLFLFLVDSSSKERLEEAGRLFFKYLENAIKYSEDTVVSVLATKWDKHRLTIGELKKEFMDAQIHPISVLDDSARSAAEMLIDSVIKRKKAGES